MFFLHMQYSYFVELIRLDYITFFSLIKIMFTNYLGTKTLTFDYQ